MKNINDTTAKRLCIARIYLRKRSEKRTPGIRGWLFPRSTARYLAEQALKLGATYATVTLGHLGFVQGARRVEQDTAEIPPDTLPTCVEVVAPKELIEEFLAAQRSELANATVVLLDGVEIRSAVPGDAPR